MQHNIYHTTKNSFATLDNYGDKWSVNFYQNDEHVKVACSDEHSASDLFDAIRAQSIA